jgi:hypothetical protein
MTIDLSGYVDVAERIRIFKEKFPEGSLQSELTLTNGASPGWLCKAYAFRSGTDERPGIGHAFEPIPGKTPYTRDSEAMNAETSAWGRAIVALGFETKKIASKEEVRARESGEGNGDSVRAPAPEYLQATDHAQRVGALPSEQIVHFGKNKGTPLSALTLAQLRWYATEWKVQDDPSDYDHRLKQAAIALHAGNDSPDFDLPFG